MFLLLSFSFLLNLPSINFFFNNLKVVVILLCLLLSKLFFIKFIEFPIFKLLSIYIIIKFSLSNFFSLTFFSYNSFPYSINLCSKISFNLILFSGFLFNIFKIKSLQSLDNLISLGNSTLLFKIFSNKISSFLSSKGKYPQIIVNNKIPEAQISVYNPLYFSPFIISGAI